jgi:hypothetical protein
MILVPGLNLGTAMIELAKGQLVSGTIRLVHAIAGISMCVPMGIVHADRPIDLLLGKSSYKSHTASFSELRQWRTCMMW